MFTVKKRIGIMIIRVSVAKVEPINVRWTAFCPSPLRRYSCPGSIDKLASSDDAPKKMDGIKSMNVWVIEMETI